MNEEKFKEIVHEKTVRIRELSQQLPVKDEQINGLRGMVKELERTIVAKDQTIQQLKAKKAELSEDIFTAYDERAQLLAYITTQYPSIIKVDLDAPNPDYADVLYIHITTINTQISFHIFKGQLAFLGHVPRMDCHGKFIEPWMSIKAFREGTLEMEWDGHTTEEKWARIRRLIEVQFNYVLDEERSTWYPVEAKNSMKSPKVGVNTSSEENQ